MITNVDSGKLGQCFCYTSPRFLKPLLRLYALNGISLADCIFPFTSTDSHDLFVVRAVCLYDETCDADSLSWSSLDAVGSCKQNQKVQI